MNSVVERRWVLPGLPKEIKAPGILITQGYVSGDQEAALCLHKKGDSDFFITLKDSKHPEWEAPILDWVFKKLWSKIDGRSVERIVYSAVDSNRALEFNVYNGRLNGLVVVKVKFENLESAQEFISPWPGAIEVTNDNRYHNFYLAINGLPSKN